ncbi:MAG: DUF4258 domain-containing protein [Betaproteobacteria bacterium]|nr:DUF4258 domain-containing protein [Betaproteobacteria bacterium]
MSPPSLRQIEKHIRASARDTANIVLLAHALSRMVERGINHAMVLETLRMGILAREPEPDPRTGRLRYRMQRYVSGVNVGAVVEVDHPDPTIVLITVIEIHRS